MNTWVRLYHDTPTDPKWKTIARKSGQRIGDVLAVWTFVLTNASANANERGRTHNLESEDIAAALDLQTEEVDAILAAMEGKVLEDGKLTGWEKRNPIKDDGAAERAKAWRERKRTQTNGANAIDKDTDKIREEKKVISAPRRAGKKPFPADWQPSEDHKTLAAGLSVDWRDVAQVFRDYCTSTGKQYADYDAAFRNFLKNERKFHGARYGKTEKPGIMDAARDLSNLIERVQGFGPQSLEIGGGSDGTALRMLPPGRGEQSRDLHGGDRGDPFGIRAGSDRASDGPEDWPASENQILAKSGGSR